MRFHVPPKTVADPVRRGLLGKSRTPDEVACSLPRASGVAAHERSTPLRAAFRPPDGPAAGRLSTLLAVTRLGTGRSFVARPGRNCLSSVFLCRLCRRLCRDPLRF